MAPFGQHFHDNGLQTSATQMGPDSLQSSSLEELLGMDEMPVGHAMHTLNPRQGVAMKAQPERQPVSGLEFQELTYTVIKNTKKDGQWTSKQVDLLQSISGQALKRQVTAILGPSGAGKSTFLDALAGRIAAGSLRGSVRVDGQPAKGSYMKQISAYVMQDDQLFPMLTVYETLLFAAKVRLPPNISSSEKKIRVEKLIAQLGLQSTTHTYIGDEGRRGVSGGERRRVSIGVDIINGPSVLFLDEPTSGLDSTSAHSVVEKLVDIANEGSTVVLTIHQPSFRIQQLLNRLIILARGKLIYIGSPNALTGHLAAFGRELPEDENNIEYFLDVIKEYDESTVGLDPLVTFNKDGIKPDNNKTPLPKTPLAARPKTPNNQIAQKSSPVYDDRSIDSMNDLSTIEEEDDDYDHSLVRTPFNNFAVPPLASYFYRGDDISFVSFTSETFSQTPGRTPGRPNIVNSFQKTPMRTQGPGTQSAGSDLSANNSCDKDQEDNVMFEQELGPKFANSWFKEVLVLMWRSWYNIIRTPELFLSREIVILVISFMLATLFLKAKHTLQGVYNLLNFFIFALTLFFFSSNDAVPAFIQERYIFIRETSHNAYRASSYVVAGLIVHLPFLAVQALTFVVMTWWVLGLHGGVTGFLIFWVVLYASLITTNSFVVLVSAVVPNYITGYSMVIALTSLFFLFCGFFLKRGKIPNYWIWLHYISAMKYPFEAVLTNQFDNDICYNSGPILPQPGPLGDIPTLGLLRIVA